MTLIYIGSPALFLSAACIGYGIPGLMMFGFAKLPIILRLTAAYFLGQGMLAGLFVVLALCGVFTFPIVLGVTMLGGIAGAASLWLYRHELRSACADASTMWLRAPFSWQGITIMSALLYLYGLSTMGRILSVDATAFYMAAAKIITHTGRIGTLPGYEAFSWVTMTGELLYASLMVLGSPGTGARFYEWMNFLPILVAMYWVARICNLSARAAFLAAVMVLTSSAAVGLWGGGKTDTFAIGPALMGVWFALASWKPDRRRSCIAVSGLFCGLAIAAKATYIVVLVPSVTLLIHWHDIGAALSEIRSRAWNDLLKHVGQVILLTGWFIAFVTLGLAPFFVKNLIIFHGPFGAGTPTAGSWFSLSTVLRLIVSYPLALTYGRYWGQMGTLSPLILAFVPLFFLIPRDQRSLSGPLAAITVSAIVALEIWMALMPSMIMPRYILASLLLLGIPAAAGAALASRRGTLLPAMVILATDMAIIFVPSQVNSRTPTFSPGQAITYFGDGDEEKLFRFDPYVAATFEVNRHAQLNDRVLLLVYPRLWLRGDLLAATSTMVDLATFQDLLAKRSPEFWTYVRNWKFLIVHTAQFDKAMVKMKPSELGFCRIRDVGGVTSFQIGEACLVCPPGIRTVLRGPFAKTWADGNLYVASIPEFESESDSAASPDRSPLALCESERRLWPSHSIVPDIRAEGGGRFSHWGAQLRFSTPDNSDPNTNGKTYVIVRPQIPKAR